MNLKNKSVRGSYVGIQVEIKMNVSDKQTVFHKKKKKESRKTEKLGVSHFLLHKLRQFLNYFFKTCFFLLHNFVGFTALPSLELENKPRNSS